MIKVKKSPKKSLGLARRSFMRRLGQNFLRDPKILRKIVGAAKITREDTVLEIGPGEGGLTKVLLEKARKVIAVEKDRKLVEFLKEKFKKEISEGRLEVMNEDILRLELGKSSVNEPSERDWRELEEFSSKKISVRVNRSFFPAKYILVGNIPYYITGAIFKKFLESESQPLDSARAKPKSITLVVQKEVAERIMARDKKESVLSISVKAFGTPEYGGIIKAGSFTPKPKVDSAIISIRNINIERLKEVKIERFFNIVKKGFSHKRKLLIKNLDITKEIFARCSISEKARAENLKVENWICLAKSLL
jgi:16S rRNA (adenine1518-N6/adenine1519-N6)-dimethyltransferase